MVRRQPAVVRAGLVPSRVTEALTYGTLPHPNRISRLPSFVPDSGERYHKSRVRNGRFDPDTKKKSRRGISDMWHSATPNLIRKEFQSKKPLAMKFTTQIL